MAVVQNSFDLASYQNLTRPTLRSLAKLAEQAERYEDMSKCMKTLIVNAKTGDAAVDLDVEERNLLSVAYKNVIGARRATWRTLNLQLSSAKDEEKILIPTYKQQIEKELKQICDDVLELLTSSLIKGGEKIDPNLQGDHALKEYESRVFYLKMAADYYRYYVEFSDADDLKVKAREFYEKATLFAKEGLPTTHPIRLGLALNFSVCYYEILKDAAKACELAKKAFDDAIQHLDQLDEAQYKDSTLIMQLLRDNLTLWQSDNAEQQ